MNTKVVIVEFRQGTKKDKGLYGSTESEDGVSRIFINTRQSTGEMINTFFHEMAHVLIHWKSKKLSAAEEEQIARLVGNVVEPCFRKYRHGQTKEHKKTG